ncbi:MAG: hypothetical protein KC502_15140 [Myxococcales bacterium]|nr:hypothetical protein [Myxococcales bacterium]
MTRKAAGIIIIGDEVLSARIAEANLATLLNSFANHGVSVMEVSVLPDDAARIATVVADFAGRFDVVVTTGGVGPTHDDLTWAAVARAFDMELTLRDDVVSWMTHRNGGPLSAEQLRMAMLPSATQIVRPEAGQRGFLLRLGNVWVLPGVPAMVSRSADRIAQRYASSPAFVATARYNIDEWEVVAAIDAVVSAHPSVQIGSYPIFDATDHRLKLTFVADERALAAIALKAATAAVGDQHLVDVVWAGGPTASKGDDAANDAGTDTER